MSNWFKLGKQKQQKAILFTSTMPTVLSFNPGDIPRHHTPICCALIISNKLRNSKHCSTICNHMGLSKNLRRHPPCLPPSESSIDCQRLLETAGDCWRLLETARDCQRLLETFSVTFLFLRSSRRLGYLLCHSTILPFCHSTICHSTILPYLLSYPAPVVHRKLKAKRLLIGW